MGGRLSWISAPIIILDSGINTVTNVPLYAAWMMQGNNQRYGSFHFLRQGLTLWIVENYGSDGHGRNARYSTMTEIIPSSTELLVRRGTTHARISRWTTSSGLRYHTVSSYTTGSRSSRSASPDDGNESYTAVAHTGSWRHMRAQNLRKEDSELARLNDVECSDDEDYWCAAPFGPGKDTPNSVIYEAVVNLQEIDKVSIASSESTSERRLYRYSTRRELVTRYEGAIFQGGKVSEPCSEEVMQAAHCLVSLKSRTSV